VTPNLGALLAYQHISEEPREAETNVLISTRLYACSVTDVRRSSVQNKYICVLAFRYVSAATTVIALAATERLSAAE